MSEKTSAISKLKNIAVPLGMVLLSLLCILLASRFSDAPTPAPEAAAAPAPAYVPFDIYSMDDADFTAVIASDLHYDVAAPPVHSVTAPLQDRIVPIIQTLLDEVIRIHPDVLILCGDLTNSGDLPSAKELSALLLKVQDAGIKVVLCPGNHDYTLETREAWADCFAAFLPPDSGDAYPGPELHHASTVKGFRLVSMDDNFEGNGIYGQFTGDSLAWLETQLQKAAAAGERPVLVTHHSLFDGGIPENKDAYVIRNDELLPLLEKHHVRLCLSGHRHSQEILSSESGSIYEIISGFPSSYPFYFGVLKSEGDQLSYQAQSIDFAAFGAPYGAEQIPEEYQQAQNQQEEFSAAIDDILEGQALSVNDKKAVRSLFLRFIDYFSRGELAGHQEEIRKDKAYSKMMQALEGTNYDVWIRLVLNTERLPGTHLSFRWDLP